MKMISWNVNGLRNCIKNGFIEFIKNNDSDIICLQETKLHSGQLEIDLKGYEQYWNYAEKKGYSGTAIFTKIKPIKVTYGMNNSFFDKEGRIITLEYNNFYIVNVYTPNSQSGLIRINYRMDWDEAFKEHIYTLENKKSVIICGDLNVTHNELDLKRSEDNMQFFDFSNEEREQLTELLSIGFVDTFRYLHPNQEGYTWQYSNCSPRRIDYFLISNYLLNKLEKAYIFSDIIGSDHNPIGIDIKI